MNRDTVRVGQQVFEVVDTETVSLGTVHQLFHRSDGRIQSVSLTHCVTVGKHRFRTVLYWCASERRWKNKLHRAATYSIL